MIRSIIRLLVLALVLVLSSRVCRGSVQLDPLGAYLISRGYGGAQLVRTGQYYHLPIIANGKAGHLVVDTGAPTTLIFRSSLKRLNLTESKTEAKEGGAFGRGKEVFGTTMIASLTAGNLTLNNVPVAVANDDGSMNFLARPNGMLGLRELLKFGAVLDLSHRLIYLRPSRPGSEVSATIRSILEQNNFRAISLSLERSHVRVPGQVNDIACHFIVDTGAFFTLLDRDFATRAKLGRTNTYVEGHGIGKSSAALSVATFPSLWVGNYQIKQASATIGPLGSEMIGRGTSSEVAGLLGVEYLALNSAIFDFVSGTLYLRPKPKQ